ncbi:hypothetical protein CEXT_136831 [Caerostris extrusa]|uniref:Uncharacterized protein n=1 Tax=Caerostris extrusa TaxID=172846 RepID=A0AAV4PP15_CAEEX|nr:hypothetical protein CEXT_136831 [Caerostris extrusa]
MSSYHHIFLCLSGLGIFFIDQLRMNNQLLQAGDLGCHPCLLCPSYLLTSSFDVPYMVELYRVISHSTDGRICKGRHNDNDMGRHRGSYMCAIHSLLLFYGVACVRILGKDAISWFHAVRHFTHLLGRPETRFNFRSLIPTSPYTVSTMAHPLSP